VAVGVTIVVGKKVASGVVLVDATPGLTAIGMSIGRNGLMGVCGIRKMIK
jgi:hypothetical protein